MQHDPNEALHDRLETLVARLERILGVQPSTPAPRPPLQLLTRDDEERGIDG